MAWLRCNSKIVIGTSINCGKNNQIVAKCLKGNSWTIHIFRPQDHTYSPTKLEPWRDSKVTDWLYHFGSKVCSWDVSSPVLWDLWIQKLSSKCPPMIESALDKFLPQSYGLDQ